MKLIIKGFVQGVGFRWFVASAARGLGLKGFVRNLPGGSVEVRAKGPEGGLNELIKAIYDGPGRVTGMETEWGIEVEDSNFYIRF
ncbi:MAG: acylphosphatase [bacterium]